MIKKAMILAAGFGKRVHPLTLKSPKPLLKIGNETLLSNTLKFLETFGIKQVVVNVHYLRKQIIEYIKKEKFNLRFQKTSGQMKNTARSNIVKSDIARILTVLNEQNGSKTENKKENKANA